MRFEDATSAAARVTQATDGASVLRGRTPEERVVRLVPEEPTPSGAATLMGRLLLSLEGRRRSDRSPSAGRVRWKGRERRAAALAVAT